jgi:hypothetical protein
LYFLKVPKSSLKSTLRVTFKVSESEKKSVSLEKREKGKRTKIKRAVLKIFIWGELLAQRSLKSFFNI